MRSHAFFRSLAALSFRCVAVALLALRNSQIVAKCGNHPPPLLRVAAQSPGVARCRQISENLRLEEIGQVIGIEMRVRCAGDALCAGEACARGGEGVCKLSYTFYGR